MNIWLHRASRADASRAKRRAAQDLLLCGAFACDGGYSATTKAGVSSVAVIRQYLNIKDLGLLNSPLSVIIPGAINVSNMLIMRNYFINSVPGALREAAEIDGSSSFNTMMRIVLPLSKPIMVVLILYYMVGHWNAYFDAMMFLRDKNYYPLQVFLRQILVLSQMGDMEEQGGVDDVRVILLYASLKYAIIVVSAVPLLIIYPTVQRFFERGIMMGSLKG